MRTENCKSTAVPKSRLESEPGSSGQHSLEVQNTVASAVQSVRVVCTVNPPFIWFWIHFWSLFHDPNILLCSLTCQVPSSESVCCQETSNDRDIRNTNQSSPLSMKQGKLCSSIRRPCKWLAFSSTGNLRGTLSSKRSFPTLNLYTNSLSLLQNLSRFFFIFFSRISVPWTTTTTTKEPWVTRPQETCFITAATPLKHSPAALRDCTHVILNQLFQFLLYFHFILDMFSLCSPE